MKDLIRSFASWLGSRDAWGDMKQTVGGFLIIAIGFIVSGLGFRVLEFWVLGFFGWAIVAVGLYGVFSKTQEEREFSAILDTYSSYISKYALHQRTNEMSKRCNSPKDFRIALLEMLIDYGESPLRHELAELKGKTLPGKPPETAEERALREESEDRARESMSAKSR